jgi:uncharacterized membrane protein
MLTQEQVKILVENNYTEEEIYLDLLQKGFKVREIELELKLATRKKLDIQSRVITLIILFGSISIGLAAVSFIASGWDVFGDFGKIAIICSSLLLSYIGAIYTKSIGLSRVYNGLLLLAQLIFGAGIFLIGEIVNIKIAFQISFLVWAIGVVCASYLLKSNILRWFMLILILFSIFGIPEFFYTYDWYRIDYNIYAILGLILSFEIFYYVFIKFKNIDYSKYLYD